MSFRKTPSITPVVIVRKRRLSSQSNTASPHVAPRTTLAPTALEPSTIYEKSAMRSPVKTSSASHLISQPTSSTKPSAKQRQMQACQALLDVFRERWPQLFPANSRDIKPFALGIHQALIEALPDIKPWRIRQALMVWQRHGRGAYWRAVLKGGPRYTLDGSPQGEITAHDQAYAREQLVALSVQKPKRKDD